MKLADLTLPPGWIAGLDVSAAQGAIDVSALVAAGVSFVWVRATDGLHDVDPELSRTAAACHAAGLPWGAYAVIEPYGVDHAEAQARHLLDTLSAAADGWELPPVLDFELGKGRTAVDLLESACRWMDVVEDALGRSPVLYAGPAFLSQLEQLGGEAAKALALKLAARPLWLADYGRQGATPAESLARGGPRVPAPWTRWDVWQVSGDGGVVLPGGHGWVDLDVFRGTVEELQALGTFDATATLPTGAPTPAAAP